MQPEQSKIIVSFSGGKDSTWMLLEMIRRGEKIDEVVYFDSGWEFPQMIDHVEKIKKIVKEKRIEFTTLEPLMPFDYYMFDIPKKDGRKGYSWCGYAGGRWGTRKKIDRINSYLRSQPNHIQCVGIAVDETERIEREKNPKKRFPLVEWNITEEECLQGCYSLGYDWGGLYEDLDRVSCKFCAFKNIGELRNIYTKMPEIWDELKDYQQRTCYPLKGKAGSVIDFEERFKLEKQFQEEGKSIKSREFYKTLRERKVS